MGDLWSAGCIFSELLTSKVLFCGKGEFEQIGLIFALLGTPSDGVLRSYAHFKKFSFKFMKRRIDQIYPIKSEQIDDENKNDEKQKKVLFYTKETVALLKEFLIYDPSKRISAENALLHAFFCSEMPKMASNMPQFEEHHVKHRRKEKRPV